MKIRKDIALLMVLSVSTLVACKPAHQAQNLQPQEIPQQTKETPNKQPELPKYTTSTPSFSASTPAPTTHAAPTPTTSFTPSTSETHQSTTHEPETLTSYPLTLTPHQLTETHDEMARRFIGESFPEKNCRSHQIRINLFNNSETEIKFLQMLSQKLKSVNDSVKQKVREFLKIGKTPKIDIKKIKDFVENNESGFKETFIVYEFNYSLIHASLEVTDEDIFPKYAQMLREIAEYKKHFPPKMLKKDFFLTVINNGKPPKEKIDKILESFNKKNRLYAKNYLSYKLQGNHLAGIFFNLKEKLEGKNNKKNLTTEELIGIIYHHAKQKSKKISNYQFKLIVTAESSPFVNFKNEVDNIYRKMINNLRQKDDKEKDINSYIKEVTAFTSHKNIYRYVKKILNNYDLSCDDNHETTSPEVVSHAVKLNDDSEEEDDDGEASNTN